jgi:hypothetical protein
MAQLGLDITNRPTRSTRHITQVSAQVESCYRRLGAGIRVQYDRDQAQRYDHNTDHGAEHHHGHAGPPTLLAQVTGCRPQNCPYTRQAP